MPGNKLNSGSTVGDSSCLFLMDFLIDLLIVFIGLGILTLRVEGLSNETIFHWFLFFSVFILGNNSFQ
ncbi:hypothetical protein C2G38_2058584 [Gigaspora rosea]|uniref:Uncharacterized protein n=1 Tax=Gigaspora rosea TaxID=44941 RepID=A0A397W3C8_9GLOM|nr:hypothetical protein C2G38_2058584 [Gigaspora rosea]